MSRRAKLFALSVAFVSMPCFAAEPVTLEQIALRAASDAATPEGQTYLGRFFTSQWMVTVNGADEPCRAFMLVSRLHEKVVIGLIIGSDGYPGTALVSPDDEGTRCIAERLKMTRFVRPPHDGFAVYTPYETFDPASGPGTIMPAERSRP